MRKHKLDSVWIREFSDVLESMNLGFTAEWRIPNRGRMFRITRLMTNEEKRFFDARFSNVLFFDGNCEYVPEIKFSGILLTDKTIKNIPLNQRTYRKEIGK